MKVSQAVAAGILAVSQVEANIDVMQAVMESFAKLDAEGFTALEAEHTSVKGAPETCVRGKVFIEGEEFGCDEVDFLSFMGWEELEIPFTEHDAGAGRRAADIWGWLTPTGREFTLQSMDNGVVVIDSSDPIHPCVIAKMPVGRPADVWADVKVIDDTMYVVKDTNYWRDQGLPAEPNSTNTYGIEIYDLLLLDQLNCQVDRYVVPNMYPNFVDDSHGRSHNLVVNPQSRMLYSVGTDLCEGGFMAFDVSKDRLHPELVACVAEDGYTHDGQCVTYDGPDTRYTGHEICFGFNEETVTIWDFEGIKEGNYEMLSTTFYPNQVYTHQGWINNDMSKVLMNDELDELCNVNFAASARCAVSVTGLTGETTTRTYVFDINDLQAPFFEGVFDHETAGIDHNLYVWGEVHRQGWGGNAPMKYHPDPNYAYMNNYFSGLSIVNIESGDISDWKSAGHFDMSPEREEVAFGGAWSGYMHPSGVYAISSIERGLFLLSPRMAFTDDFPKGPGVVDDDGDDNDDDDEGDGGVGGGSDDDDENDNSLLIIIIILLIIGSVFGTMSLYTRNSPAETQKATASVNPMGEVNHYDTKV